MIKQVGILYIVLLVLFSCASSPKDMVHYTSPVKSDERIATTQKMTDRINDYSEKYFEYASKIYRAIFSDIAFGATKEEFSKLNGFGIIQLSAITKDHRELPIKNVRLFLDESHIYDLSIVIARQSVPVDNEKTIKVFGKYRQDYYILIPYIYTQASGKIICDWSNGIKDFEILKTPISYRLGYDLDEDLFTVGIPDSQALVLFFLREFPITKYEDFQLFPSE